MAKTWGIEWYFFIQITAPNEKTSLLHLLPKSDFTIFDQQHYPGVVTPTVHGFVWIAKTMSSRVNRWSQNTTQFGHLGNYTVSTHFLLIFTFCPYKDIFALTILMMTYHINVQHLVAIMQLAGSAWLNRGIHSRHRKWGEKIWPKVQLLQNWKIPSGW